MTRQEAIDYLKLSVKAYLETYDVDGLEQNVLLGEKITEAVHMAIKALEQEDERCLETI